MKNLLGDSNPLVVSNALVALSEINEHNDGNIFSVDHIIITRLLAALNECSEWGQIVILDALAKYKPTSSHEAGTIADRVTSCLQHSNSAVVLSTIRVRSLFFHHLKFCKSALFPFLNFTWQFFCDFFGFSEHFHEIAKLNG